MLNVLICSFEKGIFELVNRLPDPNPLVFYFISWQNIGLSLSDLPSNFAQRKDVKVAMLEGKGLSRNRNNCVKLALTNRAQGFFLIADDDVGYLPSFEQIIINGFNDFKAKDILCFQVLSEEDHRPFKKYTLKPKSIHLGNVDTISSIEIAGRMEVLKFISFDERLGLGAPYPSGEETAFLADAIRRGCKIQFVPTYIVSHPVETSGKQRINQFKDEDLHLIGGRAFRIYGERLAKMFFLFSALKNYPKYQGKQSFFSYLNALNRGLNSFKKLELD